MDRHQLPQPSSPVGQIPGYDVGVDYHAYGADNLSTAFITMYSQPAVRQTVRAQLQGMADRGATVINTMIWFVTPPGATNFGETWRATFPMSDQEAVNLRAYAQDIATIRGASGNRLHLDLTFAWLGAADYTIGSPTTGLGSSNLSASEFSSRVATTTDKVLAAVGDVTRPDSVRVVNTVFFEAEVMIGAKVNEDWFLSTNYPRFVSVASQQGIRPAVYFLAEGNQAIVFDNGYTDSVDPMPMPRSPPSVRRAHTALSRRIISPTRPFAVSMVRRSLRTRRRTRVRSGSASGQRPVEDRVWKSRTLHTRSR